MSESTVVKVYETDKYIARIHKPILSGDERTRREAEVKKAIIEFKKELIRNDYKG